MRSIIIIIMIFGLTGCAEDALSGKAASDEKNEPAFTLSSVNMEAKQVSEHVYYVQGKAGLPTANEGFISNAGFVITGDGVVVFDSLGTPSLAQKMYSLIRQKTDEPVKRVYVSHYHADHIYGLPFYKALGAEIIAPAGADKYIDSESAVTRLQERRKSLSPWVDERTYVVNPDRYITTQERFKMGKVDFVVSYLGEAHSDGDLTLYVETDRVLLSGDIIFEGRIAFLGDSDTKRWLETLQKIETDNLVALIPGHGPVASKPNEAISRMRGYLAYLREKMGNAVEELVDFDTAYSETDWTKFENLPTFKEANRRNAYQVFLSIEQEALQSE